MENDFTPLSDEEMRELANKEEENSKDGSTTMLAKKVMKKIAEEQANKDLTLNKKLAFYSSVSGLIVGMLVTNLYYKGLKLDADMIIMILSEVALLRQTAITFWERMTVDEGELTRRLKENIKIGTEDTKAQPGLSQIFVRK